MLYCINKMKKMFSFYSFAHIPAANTTLDHHCPFRISQSFVKICQVGVIVTMNKNKSQIFNDLTLFLCEKTFMFVTVAGIPSSSTNVRIVCIS
jgi:hypothetical protein